MVPLSIFLYQQTPPFYMATVLSRKWFCSLGLTPPFPLGRWTCPYGSSALPPGLRLPLVPILFSPPVFLPAAADRVAQITRMLPTFENCMTPKIRLSRETHFFATLRPPFWVEARTSDLLVPSRVRTLPS